jgi:hypothetical protein
MQPPLTGFDLDTGPAVRHPAPLGATVATPATPRLKGRRRYWSIRDLSRRLWQGRGYEFLRQVIRAGILPATRSARSWWIDDADVKSLQLAFDDRAGKVRAFRHLEDWLQERCWVVEDAPASLASDVDGRVPVWQWRGTTYLPRTSWTAEPSSEGVVYRHASGAVVAVPSPRVA